MSELVKEKHLDRLAQALQREADPDSIGGGTDFHAYHGQANDFIILMNEFHKIVDEEAQPQQPPAEGLVTDEIAAGDVRDRDTGVAGAMSGGDRVPDDPVPDPPKTAPSKKKSRPGDFGGGNF